MSDVEISALCGQMLAPETTLIIGAVCGLVFGYALGFFMARGIYRSVARRPARL